MVLHFNFDMFSCKSLPSGFIIMGMRRERKPYYRQNIHIGRGKGLHFLAYILDIAYLVLMRVIKWAINDIHLIN